MLIRELADFHNISDVVLRFEYQQVEILWLILCRVNIKNGMSCWTTDEALEPVWLHLWHHKGNSFPHHIPAKNGPDPVYCGQGFHMISSEREVSRTCPIDRLPNKPNLFSSITFLRNAGAAGLVLVAIGLLFLNLQAKRLGDSRSCTRKTHI